eukprot:GGOE01046800.1.p1 GENE.GGOE01046800.1~~GGOE01046800.1.p1  ORF type:complete len:352 (+),score=97.87 GGOE01046800.1:71-1126(+)
MSLHFVISMGMVGVLSCATVVWQVAGVILLFFCSLGVKRQYHTWVQRSWVNGVGGLIHPTKLVLTGDLPNPDEPAIFIVNHQVDADWWFMWVLAKHFGKHGHLKIILKNTLKWIPVVGWGMQNFEFIFLHRDLKKDLPYLQKCVGSFLKDEFPFWILLFPEGTTIHEECIAKSQKFAKETSRPTLSKTMLPRVNGFNAIVGPMPDTIKVYDCTMVYSAYTGDIPSWNDGYDRKKDKDVPNLHKMFTGMQTPPTYVHIKEYDVGSIKKCGAEKWLDERWVEKDAILAHYATTGRMPDDIAGLPTLDVIDAGGIMGVVKLALALLAAGVALWSYFEFSAATNGAHHHRLFFAL